MSIAGELAEEEIESLRSQVQTLRELREFDAKTIADLREELRKLIAACETMLEGFKALRAKS